MPTTDQTDAPHDEALAPTADHPLTGPAMIPPEDTKPATGRSGLRMAREIAETVLLAVLLYVGIRAVVLPYQVDGASMEPNLVNHERVLVNRMAYFDVDLNHVLNWIPGVDRDGTWTFTPFGGVARGDVIVLEPPVDHDQPFIKRVIGLPGDHITFLDGYVYVNGDRLNEDYIPEPITECSVRPTRATNTCDVTVPAGSVYVLGDHRDNSQDSRSFGVVPEGNIDGKAFFSNWPIGELGPIGYGDYSS
jgi:signal peptidase I